MKLTEKEYTHRNPGASQDLVIPIDPTATVPLERAMEYVRANSVLDIPWIEEVPAHAGVAVICGAGPSLKRSYSDIRAGGEVFACSTAGRTLEANGIDITYQVIMDPLESSADDLVDADRHLIASFAHPSVFEVATRPMLWHPVIKGIEDFIPDRPFVGIGGGITVLNSVLGLAYTLGFREFRCYGVDSSYEDGQRYADPSTPPNPTTPLWIEERGKQYLTSYDLRQQAVVFLQLAQQLKAAGCTVKVFGSGLLPDLFNAQDSST